MSRHDSRKIENVKVMLLKGDNGSSIESIEKTGTSGLIDTYTITTTDGLKTTFTVTNGRAIESFEKTGTQGLIDIYTITFNDGTSIEIQFEKANVNVDTELSTSSTNPVENRVIASKINAMDANIAGTEDGATASQTYVAGDFILRNNQLYKVTTSIATDDALTVDVNISSDTIGDELKQINRDLSNLNDFYTTTPKIIGKLSNYTVKRVSFSGVLTFSSGVGRKVALADFSSILTRNTRPYSVNGYYNYTDSSNRVQVLSLNSVSMTTDGNVSNSFMLRSIDENNGYIGTFAIYDEITSQTMSGHYTITVDYIEI